MSSSATTTASERTAPSERTAASFLLTGQVQGVGLRPAVARLAEELSLSGTVVNDCVGVVVSVEGDAGSVEAFATRLAGSLPEQARLDSLTRTSASISGRSGFQIVAGVSSGRLSTRVPRDLATCVNCLSEVLSPGDRRRDYAFTSCTDCGPRYSIIASMPYERAETSMAPFALCEGCDAEFTSSRDRRFHAQTTACPACGPVVWATTLEGSVVARDHTAIRLASERLVAGEIVAIKGVGGFQLVCDATNDATIQRLRQRKRRRSKPFAVMLAERFLSGETPLTPQELQEFEGPANPVVLVPKSSVVSLPEPLAPGLAMLGILRPTSPLHWLLLEAVDRPLVVTSSNVGGEPLTYDNAAARTLLAQIADMLLLHDRDIVRPIDDSVVRVISGRTVTLRAARGITPLPLRVPVASGRQVLAVGAHQKVALALSNGDQCVLGPHIGDMDSLATRTRFVEQSQRLLDLYGVRPELIVHDLHPDYFTTRWAEEQGLPACAVQHHHAHVVSGMIEHDLLDRTVLGVAFDGTGYGSDGTLWGGEFLLATAGDFERVGSLRPFLLPGGEMAIREPWRVAVALLVEACGVEQAANVAASFGDADAVRPTLQIVERGIGPRSSSVGRLFDGVGTLVLNVKDVSFEGEAAMRLEGVCDLNEAGAYDFPLGESGGITQIDWRVMFRQLLGDLHNGAPTGVVAMRFHRGLATAVADIASRFAEYPVVLSGGCFQNRVLSELIAERLVHHSQPVCLPGVIPPNDGGLAAGQLAVAMARLHESRSIEEPR